VKDISRIIAENISRIIIIDDDPLSNALCTIMIKLVIGKIEVKVFTCPDEGFEFIASEQVKGIRSRSVILLDLNMPQMTGWDFLERFEELDDKLKKQFKIYVHSSSTDPRDLRRAGSNIHVEDFIIKPLTEEKLKYIVGRILMEFN
jgi:two-component SAPR family response regulator